MNLATFSARVSRTHFSGPLGGVVFYGRAVGGVWGKHFYEPRMLVHLRNPYGIKGVGKWPQLLNNK
jgi:hypothetical protein